MANVQKRANKSGRISYRIRVSAGYTSAGKQVFKSLTYVPATSMTERQAEKAAQKAAADFESRVVRGAAPEESLKVDDLVQKWFAEYASGQLKPYTVYNLKKFVPRVSAALGQIRVDKLRPAHLSAFYKNLSENGIRQDTKYSILPALADKLPRGTRQVFAKAAGVTPNTVLLALSGKTVCYATASGMAKAAGIPLARAFKAHEREGGKLAGSTALHFHRFLSTIFTWAVRQQLMQDNPCKRVAPPKAIEADVSFLDEEQVSRLLMALPEAPTQYAVLVQLALFTGCRRGELCGLRWSDIDFEKATVTINRGLSRITGRGPVFTLPKTKKSRRCIRLPADAFDLLRDYKKWQAQEILKLGSKWNRRVDIMGEQVHNDLLFTSWDGKPIDMSALTSWFRPFVVAHGLPPVHFHSLRHTNASLLIAAHVPITTVAGRLGHAKASTTTDIYAGFIRSADAAASDALGDVFAKIKGGRSIG